MKKNRALDSIGYIDAELIEKAETYTKKRPSWVKWGALAACLCLVVVGAWVFPNLNPAASDHGNTIQSWSKDYAAKDYFQFCGSGTTGGSNDASSIDDSIIPYAETRYFSDRRSNLEQNNIIPTIDTHPLFDFAARYNSDGSLYCVELLWSRRNADGLKDYSDLKVVAGYEEVPIINDVIFIRLDENGNVLEPEVTVTERDGIQIVARGSEDMDKTLTYQTENGWYQISGSWNDSYEAVVELLDWFWEHPIDFNQYPMSAGDNVTVTSLAETPDAFHDYLPSFSEFGFVEESTTVVAKNGVPVRFEGHYVGHVDAEKVQSQEYYDMDGFTTMHWCVFAEPDVYDLEGNIGDIHSLTKEQITQILSKEDNKVKFMQDGLLVIVYPSDVDEAWELIESVK